MIFFGNRISSPKFYFFKWNRFGNRISSPSAFIENLESFLNTDTLNLSIYVAL